MEVILLKGLKGLGKVGEIVSVKAGYFRNYLSPKGICVVANNENKAEFEKRKAQIEAENSKLKESAEVTLKTLDKKEITIIRSAGEGGHLYGSVKILDISKQLNSENIAHDKSNIIIAEAIKTLGVHPIELVLYADISATVLVNVARNKDESEMQMEKYKDSLTPKKAKQYVEELNTVTTQEEEVISE